MLALRGDRSARRLDRERTTARQNAREPKRRGTGVSYACRLRDAVHPAELLFGEARVSRSFLFRVPEKTSRTVWRCQPAAHAPSSTVAPSGPRSIALTSSCFGGPLAAGRGPRPPPNPHARHPRVIQSAPSPTRLPPSPPRRVIH